MVGKDILHYKILSKLGEGGMGVVYKALDTELNREVAIKFLPHRIAANDEERQRFKIEAQAAAALNHTNIATIFAIEKIDDETFIVMELIEGQELKDRIDAGPLPIDDAIELTRQIARGLQAAHGKEVIHRDIKSTNIMLAGEGDVKIMDFGLAKLGGQTKLTQAGTTLGTVAYMSPEQTRGDEVDHRSDIFSLGVLAYEMLTGQLPFKGDYDQAVAYSILNEDPEPVTALRTGIPMELERIVNKCLKKDPAGRFQHADELIADLTELQRASETRKILARSGVRDAAAGSVPGSTPARSRLGHTGMIGIGVIVIGALAAYWFLGRGPDVVERIPIAVVDFVNETNETELSGLSGMLITALEQSRRLSVFPRSRMFDELKKIERTDVTFIDEATGREIAKNANIQALAVASIRKFGELYTIDFKVVDPVTGEYLFTHKEEGRGQESIPGMIDKLSDKTRVDLREENVVQMANQQGIAEVTTTNLEAYHQYFLGEQYMNQLQIGEARKAYERAIALDSTFALAYYGLSYAIAWGIGNEFLAKEPLAKMMKLIDRIPEKEQYLARALEAQVNQSFGTGMAILREMEKSYPNEKEMLYKIGDRFYHDLEFAMAEVYLKKVLAQDPRHLRALQHLSWTYRDSEQYDKMRDAVAALAAVNPAEADQTMQVYHASVGEYAKAMGYIEKKLKADPNNRSALQEMATMFWLDRQYEDALSYAHRSFEAGSPNPAATLFLAWSQELVGDLDAAQETLESGLERFPGYPYFTMMMAILHSYRGDYAAAEAQLTALNVEGQPPVVRAMSLYGLAYVLGYRGQVSSAMERMNEFVAVLKRQGDISFASEMITFKGIYGYRLRRDMDELMASVQEAYALEGTENPNYYGYLSILETWAGNDEKARQAAAKVVGRDWRLWLEAEKHRKRKEWRPAIAKYERLRKFDVQGYFPYGAYFMAVCHFELGEYDRAEALAKEAQTFYGQWHDFNYPMSFHLLSKIYEKKGEKQLALQNVHKFLELWKEADPDLPDLIDAKARLDRLQGD